MKKLGRFSCFFITHIRMASNWALVGTADVVYTHGNQILRWFPVSSPKSQTNMVLGDSFFSVSVWEDLDGWGVFRLKDAVCWVEWAVSYLEEAEGFLALAAKLLGYFCACDLCAFIVCDVSGMLQAHCSLGLATALYHISYLMAFHDQKKHISIFYILVV